MRARSVYVDPTSADALRGTIVAADTRAADGTIILRKGVRVGSDDDALERLSGREIHVVELDPGELTQDEAADRLARALAGPGTAPAPAAQGQARLRATVRGVLRVRPEAVRAVNDSPPLLFFTHLDGQPVGEGDEVAGVKSAALGTPEALVAGFEAELRGAGAVQVEGFRPHDVLLVVTERLEARGRGLVIDAIRKKLAWYGSTLASVAEVAHDPGAVRAALQPVAGLVTGDTGAVKLPRLVLVSGANPLDPLDPAIVALRELGGEVLRTGVPGHPGSMAWVGRLRSATVLGVATCSGFGKDTALDLVLARVLAGEPPDQAVSAIGYGGLLEGPAGSARYPRRGRLPA